MTTTRAFIGSSLLFVLMTAPLAAQSDPQALKAAAEAVNRVFERTSYVAKIPIIRYGHHYVTPNGDPHPRKAKKQGRGAENAIQFDSGVKVPPGGVGYSIFVAVKGKDEVLVGLNDKAGARLNPDSVHILYDRPVTVEDLTPEKIALALQGIVEIRGYGPAAQVAAAFDQVMAAGEAAGGAATVAPTTAAAPPLVSLRARVEPERARAGEEVALVLEYEVGAAEGALAVETRKLSRDGSLMPTYPVREEISRGAGAFVSKYRQPLPRSVVPGDYLFQGEVCVGGDCISRSVTFEVVAP